MEISKLLNDCAAPPVTYVYATKSSAFPNRIKIGKTNDVAKRLSSMNTSCAPAPHVLVAVAATFDNTRDEKMAHAFFADVRKEGEFFELTDKVVKDYFAMHITAQHELEKTRLDAMPRDAYDFSDLVVQKKPVVIPVVSRFLSALTNMDYTVPTQYAMGWSNGFVNPTAKTMATAFQDFQTEGDCKTTYSDIHFFRQLGRYEGVTNQRNMTFRFYRINLAELKQFLVNSNEYDKDAIIV